MRYTLFGKDPYMAAGKDTFIGDMLDKIGLKNALIPASITIGKEGSQDMNRYPELTKEDIKRLNPEVIFLSSEPYPFKDKHIKELQDILPHAKILLVDGELFSWYGSRLLESVNYFNELIKRL